MKDDTSTPIADDSPNEFERDKSGTADRSRAEAAIEGLRQKGGVFVDAVRATRMPMVLTDPTLPGNPIIFANRAFLKLSGYGMEEVLGQQPHFMDGPNTDPKDAARFREMIRADQDEVLETIQYGKNGRRFVATVLISAFKDDAGRTLHHFMSWLDVTRRVDAEEEVSELRRVAEERARAERALAESEEKYRTVFNSIDEGFALIEVILNDEGKPVDLLHLETNPAYERQAGIQNVAGKRALEIAPDFDSMWFDFYDKVARTGEAARIESYLGAPVDRWITLHASRVGGEGSRKVAVVFNDVTERKNAEMALRKSELRQAFLLKFTDAIRSEPTEQKVVERATQMLAEELVLDRCYATRLYPDQDLTEVLHEVRVPDLESIPTSLRNSDFPDAFRRTFEGTLIFEDTANDPTLSAADKAALASMKIEALLSRPLRRDGSPIFAIGAASSRPRCWTQSEIALVEEVTERTWEAAERARNTEALRDSERHVQILLAELQHRVRNTLAVVRSIARRTADRSETMEDMVSHFEGRLSAFSRVQSAVTRNPEGGLSLGMLVEDELISVAAREGEQFRVKGPEVSLLARPAESISLAIHELATNAVKYGALTSKIGRIKVSWNVLKGNGGVRTLRLEWLETGLGRRPEESHEGFGHEMLRRSLPYELGAETDIQFTDDGMRFTMVMPLGPEVLSKGRS